MNSKTSAMAAARNSSPTGLSARLERYAMVLVAVLIGVTVVAALISDAADATRIGGDYAAFYAAGEIVLDGDAAQLYDSARQASAQAPLFPEDGAFLYFAYPPFVAGAYAPLAAVGFQLSLALHVILMAAALLYAVRAAGAWFPLVARHPWVSGAIALFFYPMLRAVVGGQNTALTLAIVVLAARLETEGRSELAGAAAAALLYKPQFGIPIALLLVAARKWKMLRGWLVTAGLFYGIGAVMQGPGWVTDWWRQASSFAEQNVAVNGNLFISIPGVASHLGNGTFVTILGAAWTVAVAAGVAWCWWKPHLQPIERFAVAVAGLVAILPQPLFYEAGLLLLPLAVAHRVTGLTVIVSGIWFFGATQLAASAIGFSPLVVLSIAGVGFIGWMLGRTPREMRIA